MTKIKVLLLCLTTAVLAVFLTLATTKFHEQFKPTILNIVGPNSVNKGDIIDLKASVVNPSFFLSKTVYQWKILHGKGEVSYNSISPDHIYLSSGINTDKLWVVCSAVNYHNYLLWGDATPLNIITHPISIDDSNPKPPPPPPGPTPVTDPLFAIAVFDNTNATNLNADQLKLHNSTTILNALKSLNTTWKNYDKTNPALSDAKWQSSITAVGLPALFITNAAGHVYYQGSAKSESDTLSQVNILRGTK